MSSEAETIAKTARRASNIIKTLSNEQRSTALKSIYDTLRDHKTQILEANEKDLAEARAANFPSSLIKRLDLTVGDKYDSMLQGVLDVAALDDPVGKITLATKLDEGLDLYRVTVPVGVLLVIFEARPEVIANISALALKSGNAAILKGGKESTHTFKAMAACVTKALEATGTVPAHTIQLITTREEVGSLLSQDMYIDLVIPRGSNALVRHIKENTKIPVLGHADGICSIYVAKDADAQMAARIVVDAKTNYPAGCNAVETLLLDESILSTKTFPTIIEALLKAGVTLKVTPEIELWLTKNDITIPESVKVVPATEQDFYTEFLDHIIAIKAVPSLADAIEHINEHGSHHTDCIITKDEAEANTFLKGVDSAGVYWNASTRFADGFRYGFGTEVGISTNKIHARGPVGLEGLVGYHYQLKGHGQIAADYAGAGGNKQFLHTPIDH
ncbi:uncharacterized protein SAPINGB_P002337 [Magnusiomyces paraingens]|uniref:glutamate-5-semialdehyde dehydrogenase n=1 Tax=Magnusiomyces paraingens TaxID=2606893 RepID=A0A5E8BDE3_9ASCO|nr:uncharacterized protein SAPINGB_P002337 [Saprochaete ingens]VVT49575.1 unnamed protein product [Saprochaete ingens]